MPDRTFMRAGKLADLLARNEVPDSHHSPHVPGEHVIAFQEDVSNYVWSMLQEWPCSVARVRIIDAGIALPITGKEVFLVIAQTEPTDACVARLMLRKLLN